MPMPLGLSVAILIAAEAAAAPPADAECKTPRPDASTREIVICAQRPNGYRIDPDVLTAKRGMRSGGRPKGPESMADTSCTVVGPAGCMGAGAGINLLGAAMVLGQMAARAATGGNVGDMFKTTPTSTEYELYIQAKREREAHARAEAAAAAVKAMKAEQIPPK